MNYYQHHIGDYAAATAYLSLIEDAIYTRLLRVYYRDEKPLPADSATVAWLIGLRTRKEKETLGRLLPQFFTLHEDGWHNNRADEEIAAYHNKQTTAQENGKKGGRPKKPEEPVTNPSGNPEQTQQKPSSNPEETQTKPSINPEETGSKANQEPITINQEPIKAKSKTSHATREREEAKPDDTPEQIPEQIPEQTPAKPKSSRKREDCTLQQALDDNFAATGGGRFIREDDPVFAWAEKIGLPESFLELGWEEFERRFLHTQKRQKDWRAHFRNACRRDWLGIWKTNSQGEFYLTQAGKQLERELDAEYDDIQRAQSPPPAEPEPPADDDGFDNTPHMLAHLFGHGANPLSAEKWLH